MCAQRMLRAGPWSEVVRSGKAPKPDPRQQTLDLDAPSDEQERRNSDPVAAQAQEFARKLEDLAGVLANPLDDTDAAWVNANISMVAEEADELISTLIEDAESKGLEATGDWIPMPLVEQRAFEVPKRIRRPTRADDEHNRKMNS
jgi:hypothetical protein